jgi:hypothetical protein
MGFIGFDLGKVSSQICIITEDGELMFTNNKVLPRSGHKPFIFDRRKAYG